MAVFSGIQRDENNIAVICSIFRYRAQLLDLVLFVYALQLIFCKLGSTNNYLVPTFKFKFKFCPNFLSFIFRKSQEVSMQKLKLFWSNNLSLKMEVPLPFPLGSDRVKASCVAHATGFTHPQSGLRNADGLLAHR